MDYIINFEGSNVSTTDIDEYKSYLDEKENHNNISFQNVYSDLINGFVLLSFRVRVYEDSVLYNNLVSLDLSDSDKLNLILDFKEISFKNNILDYCFIDNVNNIYSKDINLLQTGTGYGNHNLYSSDFNGLSLVETVDYGLRKVYQLSGILKVTYLSDISYSYTSNSYSDIYLKYLDYGYYSYLNRDSLSMTLQFYPTSLNSFNLDLARYFGLVSGGDIDNADYVLKSEFDILLSQFNNCHFNYEILTNVYEKLSLDYNSLSLKYSSLISRVYFGDVDRVKSLLNIDSSDFTLSGADYTDLLLNTLCSVSQLILDYTGCDFDSLKFNLNVINICERITIKMIRKMQLSLELGVSDLSGMMQGVGYIGNEVFKDFKDELSIYKKSYFFLK